MSFLHLCLVELTQIRNGHRQTWAMPLICTIRTDGGYCWLMSHGTKKQEQYQSTGLKLTEIWPGYTQWGVGTQVHWGPQVHRWLRGTEDMPGCLQREPYPYSYCQQCRLSQWYGESFLWYSVEWNKEHKGHRGLILQKSYYILHLSLRELKSQLVKRETKWWIKVLFCTQILSHRRAGHQILIPNIRTPWR